jgi:hypothetical protein
MWHHFRGFLCADKAHGRCVGMLGQANRTYFRDIALGLPNDAVVLTLGKEKGDGGVYGGTSKSDTMLHPSLICPAVLGE